MLVKGFVNGSYVSQSLQQDQEMTMNFYVERSDSAGATTRAALYPTPGVEAYSTRITGETLQDPNAPTVTPIVTTGSTVYGYRIVAVDSRGDTTAASQETIITNGKAAPLNSIEFNQLTWSAVTGAVFYQIYLTTDAGGPVPNPGYIGTSVGPAYADESGIAVTAAEPIMPETNTTGFILPDGPGRAHFFDTSTQREFAVLGPTFYEITEGAELTEHGTVAIDDNPATISSNGDGGGELFITSGGNGYSFVLDTDTFASIAALAGKATIGSQLDGYFLALDANTSTLYLSDLFDVSTWDPTQFTQRSISPDPWISMIVANRLIYLFGTETSEAWFDAGSFPFPFEPHPSGLIQYGCAAAFSPAVVSGGVNWLAATENGQGSVVRVTGFNPEILSTFALQTKLNGFSSLSDAIGDTYDDLGHTFYILTFQDADATVAWDAQTRLWCDRGEWDQTASEYTAWRPLFHAFAYGVHRMLDLASGNIYRMSTDIFTGADGLEIRRERRSPCLVDELDRVFYPEFGLNMDVGIGLSSGQGSDPQVMMRYSNDGGRTWSNERWESAGEIGEFGNTRVTWHLNGSGYRRVWRVAMTDPVPWRILEAFMTAKRATGKEVAA